MVHLNVQHSSREVKYNYIVEVSTDGAGWKTLYVIFPLKGEEDIDTQRRAEDIMGAMHVAYDYAGIEHRMTSMGWAHPY